MSSSCLTASQLRALFDILVHHQTYSEVEFFKEPEAIDRYGYPFTSNFKNKGDIGRGVSSTPLLQLLLTRVILPVPGIRDLPPEFWNVEFRSIMLRLCEADLSESYDKATLGSRKRLATAASVIHEALTRGLLAGVSQGEGANLKDIPDSTTASGLTHAYNASIHHLIYGDLIDELFDRAATTRDLEDHSPTVKAAVDYGIIHIATLLHYIFILTTEGPYLLKLLENVHSLIPYSVIGQTLRVGNAATMMNGLFRLILAKVSVGAVTNWLGLTQNAADGMNLLQRIVSLTLDWDAGDFRKATEKIKKSKNRASDDCFAAIDRHVQSGRERHISTRYNSQKQQESIVAAILESTNKKLLDTLTDSQHAQLMEYYSAQLAVRDRERIIDTLCRQSPDHTTAVIKDLLAAFEPMIRVIHENLDLRKHLSAMEKILTDLIKTSKPKTPSADSKSNGATSVPPSVDDYVDLLRRHRYKLFDYLHDVAKGCPELMKTWRAWVKDTALAFQRKGADVHNMPRLTSNGNAQQLSAGSINGDLQKLFDTIPEEVRSKALTEIDAHAEYIRKLEAISDQRMQRILDGTAQDLSGAEHMSGPGMFLSQWQSLLDETLITPEFKQGPLRRGKDVKGLKASGKTEAVASKESWDPAAILEKEESLRPPAPDATTVIGHLGPKFEELVAARSKHGLPE